MAALRTHRDRAMVHAMVLGGLRRCEVLGLRLGDVQVPERSLFIAEGKGGHQRVIPISNTFFVAVGDYLRHERPGDADTDRVFVTLKGPTRGRPLTADGIDTILRGARDRAGLAKATCHQLRHTCLTRLREAGMELEAVQAQAGHASIESTRIYLHLTNDWLADEYRRAAERDRRRRRSRAAFHPGDQPMSAVAAPTPSRPWFPTTASNREWPSCRAGTASGRHDAPLPAATHHVPRAALRRRRRWHVAPVRPLARHRTPTSQSSATSPGFMSRTTRCGSPPNPAPRRRRWRRTPSGTGCA